MIKLLSKIILLIMASCLLSSCGLWQTVKDGTVKTTKKIFFEEITALKLDLAARKSINTDEQGHPLSVVVRVYQLKDKSNFEVADYNQLLTEDKILLAQDLLDLKQYVLLPGETISIDTPLNPDSKFIGINAFYHNPSNSEKSWQIIFSKKQLSNKKPLFIELIDNTIKLSQEE